ncbi:rRNA adenine N-6-methyltransferase family protein, partial [Enterococcus faecium]|uniref:rRNA adenine N-6-methyltransferase family protein n=1 Tax=Enterococcus faecium TaxID=1352 RepID=UPI003D0E0940
IIGNPSLNHRYRKGFYSLFKTLQQNHVDSVLIVLERHQPLILKKDYKEYQSFVYKWVNREYRVLFTKNQFRQALKHANVTNINKLSKEQFLSIFNSYKLFQ